MPRYTVIALEKFIVRTTYTGVDAGSPEEAARLVRGGMYGYDSHTIEEGGEEHLETVSVEEEGKPRPVIVEVRGGVVVDVTGLPPGVGFKIKDWDDEAG